MAEQATLALQDKNWKKAERLLNQALELIPDSPGLLNNLAVAYGMQGQEEKAEAVIRDIHARFPDYLFARVSVARMALREGDFERAHALLEPMMQRKKLHYSEFNQLVSTFIDLYLAEDNRDAAQTWLQLWERTEPNNPQIPAYRMRMNAPKLGRVLGPGGKKK